MKKLSKLQKDRINHTTSTVVAGLLCVLSISKERYILAAISGFLFIVGVSLYKSIGDEKK